MIIKQPAWYDISHWKEVADFNAISPRPVGIITKATEGVSLVDDKFVRFMQGMKEAGYLRGAYHFNRKAYDGAGQARFFINVVRSYIDDDTLLILDAEEGGEQASQLWAWFETVRATFPRNILILYSSRLKLETISMTYGEKEYFKRIPVWTAGYPYNPDLFDEVPNTYIPDPTRFGPVVMWQYSSSGIISGIHGEVDLNWIDPIFAASLGTTPNPPPTGGTMKQYKVVWSNGVARRSLPTTSGSSTSLPAYTLNQVVEVVEDNIPDQSDPNNASKRWVKFSDGYYGASNYPNSSNVPQVRMIDVTPPTEPPAPPAGLPDVLWIGETRESVQEYRKAA